MTLVGLNSPPVSTKGHTRVGFHGAGGPGYGAHLDTRKECQATQEPWEMSLHEELPSLDCSSHHLPSRLTFRAYHNPILKTEFLHIS